MNDVDRKGTRSLVFCAGARDSEIPQKIDVGLTFRSALERVTASLNVEDSGVSL